MEKSESIKELATALSKAQAQIEGSKKDASNPFYKAQYSTLSSVWDACRRQLTETGLSVIQSVEYIPESPDMVCIETTLCHASGEWVSGRIVMKPVKNDPQSIGSCMTYARRYSLAAMVGIAPEDDDGNAASGKSNSDKRDYTKAIEIWKKEIINLAAECTIESFRAFWPDSKREIVHDCGDAGAAEVYKLYVETGKKLAEGK